MALMAEPKTEFGRLLRRYREAKDLTFRELAEKVPFSYTHLNRIEAGDRNPPDREGVIQIAQALGAPVDDLLLSAGYAAEEDRRRLRRLIPQGKYPPTQDEQRILDLAESLGVSFSGFSEPGFWDRTPERRRRTFIHFEGLLLEEQEERRRSE